MKKILAAVDNSAAARPVIAVAVGLGRLFPARVEAIHVREDGSRTAAAAAAAAGVPLRLLEGPPIAAILDALDAADVMGAVLGARGQPGGRRPVGRTALEIVAVCDKPVVVVPPDVVVRGADAVARVLVPLDGTEESAAAVEETLRSLAPPSVDLVVLHVLDAARTPRFLDRPERDLVLWADEFLVRYCPAPGRLALRAGAPGETIIDLAGAEHVDLIVMSWSQDVSAGHAAVVQEVLARSSVPVLLLPPAVRLTPATDAASTRAVRPS